MAHQYIALKKSLNFELHSIGIQEMYSVVLRGEEEIFSSEINLNTPNILG